jgi:hypothetical protein
LMGLVMTTGHVTDDVTLGLFHKGLYMYRRLS